MRKRVGSNSWPNPGTVTVRLYIADNNIDRPFKPKGMGCLPMPNWQSSAGVFFRLPQKSKKRVKKYRWSRLFSQGWSGWRKRSQTRLPTASDSCESPPRCQSIVLNRWQRVRDFSWIRAFLLGISHLGDGASSLLAGRPRKPDGSHWKLTQEKAISFIEDGTCVFYIESPVGHRLDVIVAVSTEGGMTLHKYLKTTADKEQPHKLLSLPTCP